MKDIIKKLLEKWLCKHTWKLSETNVVYSISGEHCIYIFICKKCGKIKKVKV